MLVSPVAALADPVFVSDNFKLKWQRADKPVNDGASSRSWLWGPEGFNPVSGTTEPYAESPGGNRQVQYFDKARMEINDPANSAVTNGLLVRELISGKLATGNATFKVRRPADDIPIAGDPAGNNGPTYFSFSKIASLNNDNPSTDRTGQAVADTLDKAGNLATSAELGSKAKYVYFEQGLKHNIPDVFWSFLNQRGMVYENSKFVDNQPVLGDNTAAPWLDATGLPITEAFWSKVTVGGQVKDVLLQAFERRVLTYTPNNPAAFQVEMGNVGRHYYNWRYSANYDLTPAPSPTPAPVPVGPTKCEDIGPGTNGAFALTRCGPAGMQMMAAAPMKASELVTTWVVGLDGTVSTPVITKAQLDGIAVTEFPTLTTHAIGKYTIKFKGQESGKTAEAYIWLDKPVTVPTIIVTPNPAKFTDLITFIVVGFKPGEPIRLNIRSPEGPSGNATGSVKTGPGGGLTDTLLPAHDITPTQFLVPGEWFISAVAVNEGSRFATARFILTKP